MKRNTKFGQGAMTALFKDDQVVLQSNWICSSNLAEEISKNNGWEEHDHAAYYKKATLSENPKFPLASVLADKIRFLFRAGGQRGKQNRHYEFVRAEVVQNTHLQKLFEEQITRMERRMKSNPDIFVKTIPSNDTTKKKMMLRLARHFPNTDGLDHVNIVLGWHGCAREAVDGICSFGAADLRRTDGGFFGAGIYLTPHAEYACGYSVGGKSADKDGTFPVLLCVVAVGNTYPVTRSADYPQASILEKESVSIFHYLHPIPFDFESKTYDLKSAGRSDKGLKAGFDSHYISVKASADYQAVDTDDYDYDEIVVKSEHQVLPIAVAYFRKKALNREKASGEAEQFALKRGSLELSASMEMSLMSYQESMSRISNHRESNARSPLDRTADHYKSVRSFSSKSGAISRGPPPELPPLARKLGE